jgi:putative transposase
MDIFENSKQTYGSPRVTQELLTMGRRVSKNRIADMMRAAEIRARKPRRYIVATD